MTREQEWGAKIKMLRQGHVRPDGKRWSQADLAAAMGGTVTVATISRWESGESAITDDHKVAVARALGVDPNVIFTLARVAS